MDGDGTFVSIPHEWDANPMFSGRPYGYATYQLIVTGLDPSIIYAFFLKDLSSSYNLYVNGVLIMKNGVFATTAEAYTPEWKTETGYFQSNADGNIEIVVEIANYSNYRGGVLESDCGSPPELIFLTKCVPSRSSSRCFSRFL
ncbi:MAG: hypothetical protein MZU97_20245 [Bacillus subtilis]|nr:hypothetical protein [Bacillus subtilis]